MSPIKVKTTRHVLTIEVGTPDWEPTNKDLDYLKLLFAAQGNAIAGGRLIHLEVGTPEWEPTTSELQQLSDTFVSALPTDSTVVATRRGVRVSDVAPREAEA